MLDKVEEGEALPGGFEPGDTIRVIATPKAQVDVTVKPGQNHWYQFTFPKDSKQWCMTTTAVNSPSVEGSKGEFSGSIGFVQGEHECQPSEIRYEVSMSSGTDNKIAKNCTLKAGEVAYFRVTGSKYSDHTMGYRLVWDMFPY